MRILCYSTHKFDQPYLEKAFASLSISLDFEEQQLSLDTVHLSKPYSGIMVFSSDNCNKPILEQLVDYGVQYIVTRSTGYDHIDLQTAADLNIKVANVPSYSPESIAEHAVAML
jgi:D-lactate dehydrogenase